MRLLIADDEPRVRSALRVFIEQDLEGVEIGEAGTIDQLWAGVIAFRPDVVILDWEFPGFRDRQVIQAIHTLDPDIVIIATSGKIESQKDALEAGVCGFVSKNDPPEKVLDALCLANNKTRRPAYHPARRLVH